MVQRVEAVVVGERDVSRVVQQQRQHVVPLLGYGVMQGRVTLGVLQAGVAAQLQERPDHADVTLVNLQRRRVG